MARETTLPFITALAISSLSPSVTANTEVDITAPTESQYWRSINDGVMGGVSTGSITFLTDHALFSGVISLENNGGFSSVTRLAPEFSPNIEQVSLNVTGDGNTYQFRLTMMLNGYRVSYKHDFKTQAGIQQTINLPIREFEARYRGREVRNAPELDIQKVAELGFLLANKKAGEFKLKIHEISFL